MIIEPISHWFKEFVLLIKHQNTENMNTYPTTPDLLDTLRTLKKEDQMDLLDYIKARYLTSSRVTEHYRKNALSQIKKALNY
ncbi:hypothetical protein [Reichenbachiella sp.]